MAERPAPPVRWTREVPPRFGATPACPRDLPDLYHWLSSLRPTCPDARPHGDPSDCSARRGCTYASKGSFHLCLRSGLLHQCGVDGGEPCDMAFASPEGLYVCPVTGFSFSAVPEDVHHAAHGRTDAHGQDSVYVGHGVAPGGEDKLAGTASRFSLERAIRFANVVRDDGPAEGDDPSAHFERAVDVMRQLCGTKLRRALDATRARIASDSARRRVAEYMSHVKSGRPASFVCVVSAAAEVFEWDSRMLRGGIGAEELDAVARSAATEWTSVRRRFRQLTRGWDVTYFVLAWLYASLEGLPDGSGGWIMPKRWRLSGILPSLRDIDTFGFEKRKFTRHSQWLLEFYRERARESVHSSHA